MILEIGLSKTNLMIGGNVTDFDSEYDYERGVEDAITWLENLKRDEEHYKDKLGRSIQYYDFPTLLREELLNHINQDFLNKNYNVFQIELKH